jgi:hypothetical protein
MLSEAAPAKPAPPTDRRLNAASQQAARPISMIDRRDAEALRTIHTLRRLAELELSRGLGL